MPAVADPLSVVERASRYLARCKPAVSGQGGHATTFRVACALVQGFDLEAGQALDLLSQWNARCVPPWSDAELSHKINSAMSAHAPKGRGYLLRGESSPTTASPAARPPLVASLPVKANKTAFVPAELQRVADNLPGVTKQYFKDRSPLCPNSQTPASFLTRLYLPGEKVIVFDVFKSQGRHVCEFDDELSYDAGLLDHLIHGCKDGVWYLCAPVDGLFHPNPRQGGKPSRRSEESVTSWRYMVIESDKAKPLPWLGFLAQVPLRIAAVYASGGKSIHALVRVDAASKADWDARVRRFKPVLEMLGADPRTMTAVQLTRLPGCYRGEDGPPAPRGLPERKRLVDEPLQFNERGDPILVPETQPQSASPWTGGKLQELLYLDPSPSGVPICQRPIRPQTATISQENSACQPF